VLITSLEFMPLRMGGVVVPRSRWRANLQGASPGSIQRERPEEGQIYPWCEPAASLRGQGSEVTKPRTFAVTLGT
jgi:hypothetical protein